MSVGCGRLAEGKGHETDNPALFRPIKKRSVNLSCVLDHIRCLDKVPSRRFDIQHLIAERRASVCDVIVMRLRTGVYGHRKESALKVDSGRKIPYRTGE